MNKLQLNEVPIYCLHIRKYRETSVILQCFSQEFGRFDLVGKGLYRPRNKNDLPEYFQLYKLSGVCRQELGLLTHLELQEHNKKLTGQVWLIACYANELLMKFLPRLEPVSDLFSTYQNLLSALQQPQNYQLELLWFEKKLLDILGYGINFYYESQGDSAIEKSSWYEYNTLSGFYLSDAKAQYALPGHIIQNLAEEVWSQDDAQYFGLAKRVVRSALKYQLGDIQLSTVSVSKDLNQFI